MNEFALLETYIAGLPKDKRARYLLRPGITEGVITYRARRARIEVPEELRVFYRFSYGATPFCPLHFCSASVISRHSILIESLRRDYSFWMGSMSILPSSGNRPVMA